MFCNLLCGDRAIEAAIAAAEKFEDRSGISMIHSLLPVWLASMIRLLLSAAPLAAEMRPFEIA
jgi:hypothetical protein